MVTFWDIDFVIATTRHFIESKPFLTWRMLKFIASKTLEASMSIISIFIIF